MILESVDEVRAQGVTVYPHVAQWAAEMAAKPATDEHIADAVATVVRLSHYDLADKMYNIGVFGIPLRHKVEMLVDFAMAYYEPADLDKLLGNDGRNAVRNEFLEVIF